MRWCAIVVCGWTASIMADDGPLRTAPIELTSQSCVNAACHGSFRPDPDPKHIRGDEYFIWQDDPHGKAYETLLNQRSRDIYRRLGILDAELRPRGDFKQQFRNCRGCHDTPTDAMDAAGHPAFLADGVSCAACHGPADRWLQTHYREEWKTTDVEEKTKQGFVSLDDVAVRAKKCVECHVGSERGEVNHDLIAAGHPVLKFELSWYEARLPKHWKPVRRGKSKTSPRPAANWLTGQIVSVEAGLAQTARRIQRDGVWPELSEYDCFACHHDLRYPSWRPELRLAPVKSIAIPWTAWNVDFLGTFATTDSASDAQNFAKDVKELRTLLESRQLRLRADEVNKKVEMVQNSLKAWRTILTNSSESKASEALLRMLNDHPNDLIVSWDRTANALLGVAAISDRRYRPTGLAEAMQQVRVPPGHSSPRRFLVEQGQTPEGLSEVWSVDEWKSRLRDLAGPKPAP